MARCAAAPVAARRRRRDWVSAGGIGCVFRTWGSRAADAQRVLTLCTLLHCLEFYRTVRSRRYQAIEATCIALGRAGIGRQRKVRLLLQDGRDVTVTLDKRMDLRIGRQYRIFCRLNRAPPPGGADLQDLPAEDSILALEDLGEYRTDIAIEDEEEPKHDL